MKLSYEQIVTLQQIKGLGAVSIRKICDEAFKSNGIFDLDELYDLIIIMMGQKRLRHILLPGFYEFKRIYSYAVDLIEESHNMGIGIVSKYDDNYPRKLLSTIDERGKTSVPIIMYYRGHLSIADKPSLAIIGTRKPSLDGMKAGRYLSEAFASYGLNIVSGLASGCDTASHYGALQVKGGLTTAVLAHGLDSIYPRENVVLARLILDNGGLLLSEYPIGERVSKYNLVVRDRIQAALADAMLVIQSSENGGTIHTVRSAMAAAKKIYVAKFRIASENSKVNEYLVNSVGAKWIDSQAAIGRVAESIVKMNGSDYSVLNSVGNDLF